MSDTPLTFQAAAADLRQLGLVIESHPGEYRVNYRHGDEATAYYTDDLTDALATGFVMAQQAPPEPPLPPLGPTGRRQSRRGLMLIHNRKLAARRRALSRAPAWKGKKP